MYLGAFENQNEQFAQSSFGLLEKSHILSFLHPQTHPRKDPIEENFQEIFLTSIAPNCSTISTCTQEDRNFQVFSLPDEFFGESVDHFLYDQTEKKHHQHQSEEFHPENAPEIKKMLQEVKVEQQACDKEEEPLSSHDETKNIPKNYIKAIFTFILQNEKYMQRLMTKLSLHNGAESEAGTSLLRFIQFIKQEKKLKKYTIQRLKSLWTNPENGKAMRIISCDFLRRRSMGYIFGSKIEKKMSHIKHRYKFIQAIQNPAEFTSIK